MQPIRLVKGNQVWLAIILAFSFCQLNAQSIGIRTTLLNSKVYEIMDQSEYGMGNEISVQYIDHVKSDWAISFGLSYTMFNANGTFEYVSPNDLQIYSYDSSRDILFVDFGMRKFFGNLFFDVNLSLGYNIDQNFISQRTSAECIVDVLEKGNNIYILGILDRSFSNPLFESEIAMGYNILTLNKFNVSLGGKYFNNLGRIFKEISYHGYGGFLQVEYLLSGDL